MNKTVAELEALPQDIRVFIVRIRHGGEIVEATPTSVIRQDDVVAVAARQEIHVERGAKIGPEVDDKALLDIPIETLDVVETQRAFVGKTLAELAQLESARGVFLRKLIAGRAGDPHFRRNAHRSGGRAAFDRHRSPRSSGRRRNWGIRTAPPRRRT